MPTLDALIQLTALDRLPRSGWILAGVAQPETIAGHALGTALVALALGAEVEPPLDLDRAVALAVLHDAAEAVLTDIPRPASKLLAGAKTMAERSAADDLFGRLSPAALERGHEALGVETREARFVRLCDRLQMGVQLCRYLQSGVGGLEEFRHSVRDLDCSEFPACERLRRAILERTAPPGGPGGPGGPGATGATGSTESDRSANP